VRLAPEVLVDRYEHLRQQVLSQDIGSRLGLSVFLRQGLVGWMQVQSFLAVTDAPAPGRRLKAPLPQGLAGELTRILTQLIVTHKEMV
jgi:hypothetical protein